MTSHYDYPKCTFVIPSSNKVIYIQCLCYPNEEISRPSGLLIIRNIETIQFEKIDFLIKIDKYDFMSC